MQYIVEIRCRACGQLLRKIPLDTAGVISPSDTMHDMERTVLEHRVLCPVLSPKCKGAPKHG